MKTDNLRVNELEPDAFAWYLRYLEAMDARDVEAYGRFLAETCELRFNNEPPTQGRDAILKRLAEYWKSFAALEHDLLNIYGSERAFMLEARNAYTRLDGKPVTCRAVAMTDRDGAGLVASVRLYTDVSALFA